MKHVKTVLSIIMLCLISLGLASCNYNYYKTWANYKNYTAGGGTFAADEVSSISVDWVSGDIQIVAAEVDAVTVYEESKTELKESEKLRHYLSEGLLDIKFAAPNAKLLDIGLTKTLYIQVPQSIAKSLSSIKVDAVSSAVSVKNIDAANADIDSVSGKVTLDTCGFSICDIDSVSGRIDILSSKIAGLNIESVSGEIKVANSEVTDFALDTTSGSVDFTSVIMPSAIEIDSASANINLTLPENNGFTLDFDTISGELSCAFATTTTSKEKHVYGDGVNVINIETISGNLSIQKL